MTPPPACPVTDASDVFRMGTVGGLYIFSGAVLAVSFICAALTAARLGLRPLPADAAVLAVGLCARLTRGGGVPEAMLDCGTLVADAESAGLATGRLA